MTLNQLQRNLITSASKAVDKLHKLLHPKTETHTVIITLEFEVHVSQEPAEEDTNYSGRVSWDFDDNEINRQIDDKIEKFLAENNLIKK